jgi:hypothetical protein
MLLYKMFLLKINLAGFVHDFKLFKLEWNLNQNLKYNSFRFDSNLKQISNSTYQSFPLASNFDYQKFQQRLKSIQNKYRQSVFMGFISGLY